MNLRVSPIVTAIVTATTLFAAPASAQLVTVCTNATHSSAEPQRFSSRPLADVLIPLSGRAESKLDADADGLIALWQDEKGFDILVNWGKADQHSLRDDGAEILGMAPSLDLVHLMVARGDGGLEHFLFDLDANGSGELLRSLASEASGADSAMSDAVCVKPR